MEATVDLFPFHRSGGAAAPITPIGREPVHEYLLPVALPFGLPTRIYGAMLAIWHLRPVLQRRFPLHKGRVRDFIRYLAWCVAEGRRQYPILRAIPEWDAALSRPIELPQLNGDRWQGGYSVAMFLFGVARHHYTFGLMLRDASTRAKMARAYWRGERHKRELPSPGAWQLGDLPSRFGSLEDLIATIRLKHVDKNATVEGLVEQFDLGDVAAAFRADRAVGASSGGHLAIVTPPAVPTPTGIRRSPVRLPKRAIRSICWALEKLEKKRPSEFALSSVTGRISVARRPAPCSVHPFGVNLFGYAKGEIGIGEDVRLVAQALQANGIPFCIVNVQPGSNVSQLDTSVDGWISEQPRYAINIFCVTGVELARYACERGLDIFRGRYTIGFWPWELPEWPASCNHAFSLVDEIWGISRYTANAYHHAPCPVYAMSLPVVADPISTFDRAHFGLPGADYLFVFSFDLNSTLSRKNPAAVVRAFQRAFPRAKGEAVGLVLKASHTVSARGGEWLELKAMINADPRIHVIEDTLRKPDVLGLYRCCDCYVSLHRAEGFGRCLAEALLLDLQLIATGFSGNLDFCAPERVGLVRYKMKAVRKQEYFHSHGQAWADPDIDHAASLMREVRSAPRDVTQRSFDFSPARVGERYARRLREIYQQFDHSGPSIC